MPKEFSSLTESFNTVELSDPAYERDGLRAVTVKSRHLGRRADVTLWAPKADRIGTLLILLHGVYGSHWAWSLKGGVHRTAQCMTDSHEIAPMVIAMPSDGLFGDGSGYLTWTGEDDVERWIIDEVPSVARIAIPNLLADARVAIAGLSMGGYAALRLGSKYADRFRAISAHSSFTEIEEIAAFVEEPVDAYLQCAVIEELRVSYWLRKHRDRLPSLRFDCGVDDNLIESNRALHRMLTQQGIEHAYAEFPGSHEWPYWEKHVAETLRHTHRHCHEETDAKAH